MNHDVSQKLWRFTEPNDSEQDVQKSKMEDKTLNIEVKNYSNNSIKTKVENISNSITAEPLSTKRGTKNFILLKDIRLLKVHICKSKSNQDENSQNSSLPKLLLKDKGQTSMGQLATDNVSSLVQKSDITSQSLNSIVDQQISIKSNMEQKFIGPSDRWTSKPKSYKGAKKTVQRPLLWTDTTDGETSGMGSSVDDVFESSTESEAAASFLPPKTSSCRAFPTPTKMKRRGGWPKGRKRNTNTVMIKNSYPKSPTTAFGYFLIERLKMYQEIEPNAPIAFLSKILGTEWKHLKEEDKWTYLALSEADKQRYRNEVKYYRLSRENQLRKKRAKNSTVKEKKSIGEESSDCTDEVEDDENGALYCRTCDQWFTSLHNKREHLYGRYHLQALKDGQPKMRKSRWKSSPMKSVTFAGADNSQSETCHNPLIVKSDSEDDVSMSTGDERASKSDCQSYRESTTEDEDETISGSYCSERVSDCMQAVLAKVYDREQEIFFLKENLVRAEKHQQLLSSSLTALEKRRKELQTENNLYTANRRILTRQLRSLWQVSFAVDEVNDEPSLRAAVELFQQANADLKPSEDNCETKTTIADSAEIGSCSVGHNSPLISGSDIDNFDLETSLDLENFSTSLLGDDIDFNLFSSDFFQDIEHSLKECESNET